jgi:hypothetical protein
MLFLHINLKKKRKTEEEKKNKTKPRGGQRYKRDTEEPPFVSREEN